MNKKEKNYNLVNLDEESQLKIDLNKGIASLQETTESHFQPHICLNRKEGMEVIRKISQDPERANTEFSFDELLIHFYGGVWLNISFFVYLDQICFPSNAVLLTPRQTGYIVRNLPEESQKVVLEKARIWFFEKFLEAIKEGLRTITEQFEKGDFLIESDRKNRIFDIHGERGIDIPYTEWRVIGDALFEPFFYGFTMFQREEDPYERIDKFLKDVDNQRILAVESALTLFRSLK